jgi:hypothetical protein
MIYLMVHQIIYGAEEYRLVQWSECLMLDAPPKHKVFPGRMVNLFSIEGFQESLVIAISLYKAETESSANLHAGRSGQLKLK